MKESHLERCDSLASVSSLAQLLTGHPISEPYAEVIQRPAPALNFVRLRVRVDPTRFCPVTDRRPGVSRSYVTLRSFGSAPHASSVERPLTIRDDFRCGSSTSIHCGDQFGEVGFQFSGGGEIYPGSGVVVTVVSTNDRTRRPG